MFKRQVFLFTIFAASLPPLSFAQDQTALQLMQNAQASIVQVRTENSKTFTGSDGQMRTGTYHTQGLGVILDSYGTIVTNTHVVANAPHIYVGLSDGTVLEAKIVYSSDADFSFIKIDPPYPLTAISWADAASAAAGTSIFALSNDDSDQEHVVGGAITGTQNGNDTNDVELLQMDLNLFHGDSGGPVLDAQGELLGLIMAKSNTQDNQSYAIASNKIQREYQQYQQNLPS